MPRSDPATGPFRLIAHAPDESTRIEILDGNLRPVRIDQNLGDVSVELPAGVYTVRFHQGRTFTEKLAALMPASPVADLWLKPEEQPEFATAAPVARTTTTHEWQSGPAKTLSRSEPLPPPLGHNGGSHLLLFLRNPFSQGDLPRGVVLHDIGGEKLFDLALEGHRGMSQRGLSQQWCGAHLNVNPGAYRLRRTMPGRIFAEQIVYTQPGWQTQIFLMTDERAGAGSQVARTSILMARPNVGFDFDRPDFRWTESALRALESKRNIPGSIRSEMLWAKFENPMLGIYAGLLHLRRHQIDVGLMRTVFDNLHSLAGSLPDVLAIGWGIALRDETTRNDSGFMMKLRQPAAFVTPPMLRESWEHLLHASAVEPELVPDGSLSDRIGGRLIDGSPWVTWLGELPPAEPTTVEILTRAAAEPGVATARDGLASVLAQVVEGATHVTLRTGLPLLATALSEHAEARFWLQTKRFSDLERSVAYWLQPALDPRVASVVEADSNLRRTLRDAARSRAADETALLTELNVSSTTALRAAWTVFLKLFVGPVLPDERRLDQFVKDESRGHATFEKVLRDLHREPSRLQQPISGRKVSLLEFAYLYYRASPAEGPSAQPSTDRLALRLDEAGFVATDEGQPITPLELSIQHAELRQHVIRALEGAMRREAMPLPPMWQLRVCPRPEEYSRGKLFPLLENESTSAQATIDSASDSE